MGSLICAAMQVLELLFQKLIKEGREGKGEEGALLLQYLNHALLQDQFPQLKLIFLCSQSTLLITTALSHQHTLQPLPGCSGKVSNSSAMAGEQGHHIV